MKTNQIVLIQTVKESINDAFSYVPARKRWFAKNKPEGRKRMKFLKTLKRLARK